MEHINREESISLNVLANVDFPICKSIQMSRSALGRGRCSLDPLIESLTIDFSFDNVDNCTLHHDDENEEREIMERVAEMIEMETSIYYTCDPRFMPSWSILMASHAQFLKAFRNSSKLINILGYGMVSVEHLYARSPIIPDEAFDLKMKLTSYWKVVSKRLVDCDGSNKKWKRLQRSIHLLRESRETMQGAIVDGNSQVKDNKIDLLVQQYEQFVIFEDESIDSAFARFNIIITSLKALDEGYSSKNYVRKFLRALHPKWRAKVTAIEE
ncbi:hypothetical protein Tco_0565804 [Tanacetum coccineum]